MSAVTTHLELLRISTAGSVDDGKSTLIGRLLYDSKAIPEDQYEAIQRASDPGQTINLALLTDGLRAEREQQITIDVAYRYFATDKRRFIIADTPGHAQYTRNMVTGASTADLAIILVDARKGLLPQSKRHAVVAALLGVPHIVLAVNKMDLVGFDESIFKRIISEFEAFLGELDVERLTTIPISALEGDNVVTKSERMPWYHGRPLLEFLETVPHVTRLPDAPFRFPVQCVIRPNQDFRGFAGTVVSGKVRVGDAVVSLPSGKTSRIKEIVLPEGPAQIAGTEDAATLVLEDEVDTSRGDLLAHPNTAPETSSRFEAMVCWMGEKPLKVGRWYVLAHATRQLYARVTATQYHLDVETLNHEPADTLNLNELGSVVIETAQPLVIDTYKDNRSMGGLILIDPDTNVPVAGGMISRVKTTEEAQVVALKESYRDLCERRHGHSGCVILLTGVDSFNLRTFALTLEKELVDAGFRTALLTRDLFAGVGQSFVAGVLHAAPLMVHHGLVTLCVACESDGEAPAEWIAGLTSYQAVKINLNREADIREALQRILNLARPLPGL